MRFGVVPLRRYVLSATDGPFGSALKSEHYSGDGARVIRLGNIGTASWRDEDAAFIPLSYWSELRRHHAAPGDLIVAGLGDEGHPVGRACVLPKVGVALVKADCFRLAIDSRSADARFLAWYLSSTPALAASEMMAEGSTRPRLTLGKALSLRVPTATLGDQSAIADYLDAETARIDALIVKKRALLDALSERDHALASGLLEAVSAQSRTIHLGQVLERLIDYRGATPEKSGEGVPLLTASNIVDGQIDMECSRQFVSEEVYLDWMHRGLPRVGDILLTTEAPLGEVALIEDHLPVALAQRLMLLRVRTDIVTPDFLVMYLWSGRGRADLQSRASGSTVMGVRTDRLREVRVQVPPLDVQAEIVLTLSETRERTAVTAGLLQRQIDLLAEHRQALITATVTGELEVPGLAA